MSLLHPRMQGETLPNLLILCWRPRRDLNPCYRRERDAGGRNSLKLKSTVGHQKYVLEPLGTLIEPLSNPRKVWISLRVRAGSLQNRLHFKRRRFALTENPSEMGVVLRLIGQPNLRPNNPPDSLASVSVVSKRYGARSNSSGNSNCLSELSVTIY